jgi:hypothetical protein
LPGGQLSQGLTLTLAGVVWPGGGVRDEPAAGVAAVRGPAVGSGHDCVGGGADCGGGAGACYLPARMVPRVDPTIVLREK